MKKYFALFILLLVSCSDRKPDETDLVMDFIAKREKFEIFKEKMCLNEYDVISRDPQRVLPDDMSEAEKLDNFSKLKELGVRSAQLGGLCEVSFLVWAKGWAAEADYINYIHVDHAPSNVVSSFRNIVLSDTEFQVFYLEITGNWYLQYVHWP